MSEQRPFASEYERHVDLIKRLQAPQPDPIQESLSAIRDAITSRDRHFDALTEQLRQGFQAVQRQTEEDRAAVQGQIEALGAQLEVIEQQLETVVHQLARLGLFDVIAARLTAIEAQLTESKRPRKPAGRKKAKRAK